MKGKSNILHIYYSTAGPTLYTNWFSAQEHRDLGISQLQRLYNPDRYVYKENASKNRQGGIIQMRLEYKSVTIVANPLFGDWCHVFLLDTYIGKLPQHGIDLLLQTFVKCAHRHNKSLVLSCSHRKNILPKWYQICVLMLV